MSEGSPDDADLRISSAAGSGLFAGVVATLLLLWVWGLNLVIMAWVYGYVLASLRSWPELAAILTMIGTTVVSCAIYDVVALDVVRGVKIGLIVVILALFAVYVCTVSALVNRARVHAAQDREAIAVDVARTQHWEERWYFAPLRAARAAGQPHAWLFFRPFAWVVFGFVVAASSNSRLVAGLAWSITFFQTVVLGRMTQYVRRLYQPSGATIVAQAERRPILFLRPFALDALPVNPIGDEWYAIFHPFAWLDKRTFEEHLATIFGQLGPVIAIGRPGEEVAPLGAAREYADEASWRALVLDRAVVSEFVIMEVDATRRLSFSITDLGIGGHSGTFLETPPRWSLGGSFALFGSQRINDNEKNTFVLSMI